jgi:cytoskeleton protein RodZ
VESRLAEQLKRITEHLKTQREQSGIELEQIAAETFIPLRLLKALDEGKFERLPEAVFVQGFIRRYGDAVGLDGRGLAQEFSIEPPTLNKPAQEFLSYHPEDDVVTAASRTQRKNPFKVPEPLPPEPIAEPTPIAEAAAPVAEAAAPVVIAVPAAEPTTAIQSDPTPATVTPAEPVVVPEPVTAIEPTIPEASVPEAVIPEAPIADEPIANEPSAEEPSAEESTADREWAPSYSGPAYRGETNQGPGNWIYWLSGLIALALLSIGALLISQPKPTETQSPSSSQPSSSGSASSGSSAIAPSPTNATPTPQSSVSPSPQSAPHLVKVKAIEENWLEVVADGTVVISEVVPKGTEKTFTAKQNLSLNVGNAAGITYSYNQSPAKPVGTAPDPASLTFPTQP